LESALAPLAPLISEVISGGAAVAFRNGHSSGTRYTIDYARQLARPVKIIRV
jgi:hypothetical protein